jgi:hypothetical protein
MGVGAGVRQLPSVPALQRPFWHDLSTAVSMQSTSFGAQIEQVAPSCLPPHGT